MLEIVGSINGSIVKQKNKFLQPIGSPSPGGSSINADDDTDDDEFRGPVSTDFINTMKLTQLCGLRFEFGQQCST
ncbi:hypothetical protein A2U01_0012770 [Trifolium medium]|uniref:Uncharacterized protein n=1 Tax=Trifolium medium TaxID=97028 RepID=A0A392MWC7_9FABA|nr:hypothetical protein [Trifolium medium]